MAKEQKKTKKTPKYSKEGYLDYDLGSESQNEQVLSSPPLKKLEHLISLGKEKQASKQKQDNLSKEGLDESNPSGGVQPIEETATFSQVKKVMGNFKKKSKHPKRSIVKDKTQNKKDNFDLSQMSPTAKKLEKDLLELSKTTKVRPTLVSQKQSPSFYQIISSANEEDKDK